MRVAQFSMHPIHTIPAQEFFRCYAQCLLKAELQNTLTYPRRVRELRRAGRVPSGIGVADRATESLISFSWGRATDTLVRPEQDLRDGDQHLRFDGSEHSVIGL